MTIELIAGKYKLMGVLGRGGMSTVYKARLTSSKKTYAIKLLNFKVPAGGTTSDAVSVETRASIALRHPNLRRVHEVGVSRDGQPYIVMDLLPGISLADYIASHGRLKASTALPFFIDIARGLAYAHSCGVLHTDVKPSNVMLTVRKDKKAKALIVDFGLARSINWETSRCLTSEIYGSPLYMSPEQCKGLPLDFRTDIYSFGCLMYETLTGDVPIKGETPADTFKLKFSQSPRPFAPQLMVPDKLARLVMDCLAVNPAKRPCSVKTVLRLLSTSVPSDQLDRTRPGSRRSN